MNGKVPFRGTGRIYYRVPLCHDISHQHTAELFHKIVVVGCFNVKLTSEKRLLMRLRSLVSTSLQQLSYCSNRVKIFQEMLKVFLFPQVREISNFS